MILALDVPQTHLIDAEVKVPSLLAQKQGGAVMAVRQRKLALGKYYADPGRCLDCGHVIHVGDGQKVSEVRRKRFCDHSCAAKYNNRGVRRTKDKDPNRCQGCDGVINGLRIFCDSCLRKIRVKNAGKRFWNNNNNIRYVGDLTKGELRERSKSYTSFRSRIGSHARRIYARSGKPYQCSICEYGAHVDICHIKDVSEFSDNVLISEINAIENLTALCLNDHWEFDHGLINLQ